MPYTYRNKYVKGVVICHGKSEWHISRYISTNLHLQIKAYAKDKGKHSIQITSLLKLLKTKPFDRGSSFAEEYAVEATGRGKNIILVNFKLFIIMDTDDCSDQQRNDFLSKKMFEGHWLYEYIVPIANTPSLESVLLEAKIMPRKIHNNVKGSYYNEVFPINDKPLSDNTLEEVKTLRYRIARCKNTNLLEYIDYCLALVHEEQ